MEPTTAAASADTAATPDGARAGTMVAAEEITPGRLFSRTVETWWRNLVPFGGFALVFFVPWGFGFAALVRLASGPVRILPDWKITMAYVSLLLPIGALLAGGLAHGATEHLAARRVRVSGMLAATFRHPLSVVGVGVLSALAVVAGLGLLVVPGLVAAGALSLAMPAVVLDGKPTRAAIAHSRQATRGHRVAVVLAGVGLALLYVGASAAADRIALVVADSLGGGLPFAIAATLLSVALKMAVMPLPLVLPAVARHEIRVAAGADPALAEVFE